MGKDSGLIVIGLCRTWNINPTVVLQPNSRCHLRALGCKSMWGGVLGFRSSIQGLELETARGNGGELTSIRLYGSKIWKLDI